jgi:hypothetical protein
MDSNDPVKLMYKSPFTLMAINKEGKIRTLFVPIRAQCIESTLLIPVDTWIYIEQVKEDKEARLLYLVFYDWLPYHQFRITAQF